MKQEKGETNVRVVKEPVFREKPAGSGNDHKKMQILRENFYAAGKCPALAGLLYGMQSEVQAEGNPYRKVQKMREDIHIPVRRPALAAILSGVPGKAETEMKTVNPAGQSRGSPCSTGSMWEELGWLLCSGLVRGTPVQGQPGPGDHLGLCPMAREKSGPGGRWQALGGIQGRSGKVRPGTGTADSLKSCPTSHCVSCSWRPARMVHTALPLQ